MNNKTIDIQSSKAQSKKTQGRLQTKNYVDIVLEAKIHGWFTNFLFANVLSHFANVLGQFPKFFCLIKGMNNKVPV